MFIVGSGFTKGIIGNDAPTNPELLPRLRSLDPGLWEGLSPCADTDDIEIVLTRLDMEIQRTAGRQPQLIAFRQRIEDQLSDFFSSFRFKEEVLLARPWLQSFVPTVFRSGDVVVCLNYDCLLEGLLDRFDLWTPNGGYGPFGAFSTFQIQLNQSPVTVLKVHGSENFHRDPVVGSRIDKAFMFTVDESIFPRSGKNRRFCWPEVKSAPGLIAPSFVKVAPYAFVTLMLEALDAVAIPETLVVIGCGLRPEDSFLHLLVWRFLQGLLRGPRRVLVADRNASEISQRLSKTLSYDLKSVIAPVNGELERSQADLIERLSC